MSDLTHLSAPIRVCQKEIKNRIVVPAMADFGMTGPDGLVNQRHIERYGAYARGGAGLIIIEACAVTKFPETRGTIGLYSDECLPGLEKLARAATENNAVSLVQIMDTGLSVMPENSIEEISREKFRQYRGDFVSAALRCKKAGFDGVELHAAHGMYLDQVIETSRRGDGYGGSFTDRLRLLTELIEEIKAVCGHEFIVSVRFGSSDLGELVKIAKAIEMAGGDILDVSTGMFSYGGIPADFPYDGKLYAASLVKRNSRLPVIGVGKIQTGIQAEEILDQGIADMAAVGRGHLCNPDWASRIFSGEKLELCRECRTCMWYIDGRKCPVARARKQAEGKKQDQDLLIGGC